MKHPIYSAFALISIMLGLSTYSCTDHSEEELYGIFKADTSRVSWDYPIRQILETNCVLCHNEDIRYGGVRHDTYSEELRVVRDGRLRGVVNHLPTYPRMPYQRGQLPEHERELINHWIDTGAPEN